MKDWNVLITTQPRRECEVLSALNRLGVFTRPEFKGVLIGRVVEVGRFLEEIHRAREEHAVWRQYLLRVLPVEQTFLFTLQTFEERLKEAVTPFIQRMVDGTFYVRLERRGYKGQIISPDVERRLGDYVRRVATQQGKTLRVSFPDSDYVVMAETVGSMCGVALLTRELRARYPFVKIR